MKHRVNIIWLLLILLYGYVLPAQTAFLTKVPADRRVQTLWQFCEKNLVSDPDSAATEQFFNAVAATADSLGDVSLKRYAGYFRVAYRVLFSYWYDQSFEGDYRSALTVLGRARAWAFKKGYSDIVASCEHYSGQIYFWADRYGPAFEHMLQAQKTFQSLRYENVPNASRYLYQLGLAYYRFDEWDKAINALQSAVSYPFILPREEINTYNAIGLIYGRNGDLDNAIRIYRKAIAKAAAYSDTTWVGITSGNLGNVFLQKGQNDSALFYHRINYAINSRIAAEAHSDAAFTALAMATAFVRKHQPDSTLRYIRFGQNLATQKIENNAFLLEFQKRLLSVQIELSKSRSDYRMASLLSDSLAVIKDTLQRLLDGKILSRAVQKAEAERYLAELKLLETEKDLSRLRFYIVIVTLLFVIVSGGLLFNRFRMGKQREAERAEKEKQLLELQKQRAEEKLQHAEASLGAYLNTIGEKTALIENLNTELKQLKDSNQAPTNFESVASNMEKLISSTILTDDDWRHFRHLFEQVHPGFLYRFKEKFPELSPAEMRLLILTKLKLPSRDMAHMLGITIEAIRKSRYRVRKKLNLEPETDLEEAIGKV